MTSPRVIAGTARGLRLTDVPGDVTRPITDRVKEALFNILGADIEDAAMLDLFGGTGSVGIEALSRGACFVRFCDKDRGAYATIQHNLKHTRLEHLAELRNMDAYALLRQPPDRQFEYIYIAPPQYKQMWIDALRELDKNPGWMTDDAWVIVQIHPIEYQTGLAFNAFTEFEQRRYGSTLLVFYERNLSEEENA
jgi:16S rRNA (guanine(966)-N(2))-methyltransferase RsmD